MARAEEAELELVADYETVDGWIQSFSGKKRAEIPEALIVCDDGTRILHYPGKSKQRGYRYGRRLQQEVRPMRFPLKALRQQQTPTCIRIVGIRNELEAIAAAAAAAAAGSSGVPATVGTKAEVKGGSFFKHPAADPSASGIKTDQVTQGSLLKRPREDFGMSTGSLLLTNQTLL